MNTEICNKKYQLMKAKYNSLLPLIEENNQALKEEIQENLGFKTVWFDISFNPDEAYKEILEHFILMRFMNSDAISMNIYINTPNFNYQITFKDILNGKCPNKYSHVYFEELKAKIKSYTLKKELEQSLGKKELIKRNKI